MIDDRTDEEKADCALLGLANERRKLAIKMDAGFNQEGLDAFERATEREWIRLIDVCPVLLDGLPQLCRVFMLTPAGLQRLGEVAGKGPRQ